LSTTHKAFGDTFAAIASREQQKRASDAFSKFGEAHRQIEKYAHKLLETVKPMINDLNTYLSKAIPDSQLTIRKYGDIKFEYLVKLFIKLKGLFDKIKLIISLIFKSYCLKVKEMDDEEYSYVALQEPLYRVETGNYEYRSVVFNLILTRLKQSLISFNFWAFRLILRCRQLAREKFAKHRQDVLVKLELLDQKHGKLNILFVN
jgi:hypothetical protein